jgi:hypothetical protein
VPDLSDAAPLLAVAAWTSATLCVGHILGAWPGQVMREREQALKERDLARIELGQLQSDFYAEERRADDAERRARAAERQYLDLLDHNLGAPE